VCTKNDIHTLANVVIVDPTQMDLLPQFFTIQGFVVSNAVQTKERSYHNRHPINQFFPIVIEVFGCLHEHVDMFLHDCGNAICSLKGLIFLPWSLFSSKSFDRITKHANILHIKLGGSCRLNYFPTSTPSKHTSHYHD
jgi:hypothetical protein